MEQKTTATSGYADSASAYRASIESAVRAVLTANKDGVLLRSVTLFVPVMTYAIALVLTSFTAFMTSNDL